MLRLEKLSGNEIAVRLRRRDRLLSPLFLKALLIALGLHLFGLLFFQIKTFKLSNDLPHPPVRVNVEPLSDGPTLTMSEGHSNRSRYRLEPKSSFPQLPPPPLSTLAGKLEYSTMARTQLISPFVENDEKLALPAPILYAPAHLPSVEILTFGSLADLKFLDDGTEDIGKLLIPAPLTARYIVHVEGKTGMVIWQEKRQVTKNATLDEQAEQILANMRFQKRSDFFVRKGEIEIHFSP